VFFFSLVACILKWQITAAKKCVVHFYHTDFHRCRIMDKHLEILAHNHPETLFLKINAEKAPFFCAKLDVVVRAYTHASIRSDCSMDDLGVRHVYVTFYYAFL